MSSRQFPRFDDAARCPTASARSKASTASPNRPSWCSRMPLIFNASACSASRASAHLSQPHAPPLSPRFAQNWHHAICVSTCSRFSANAFRRHFSAASMPSRSRSTSARFTHPEIRSGLSSTARRNAASAEISLPCSRSSTPRFIHADAKSGRSISARRYRLSASFSRPIRTSTNPAANSPSASFGRNRSACS